MVRARRSPRPAAAERARHAPQRTRARWQRCRTAARAWTSLPTVLAINACVCVICMAQRHASLQSWGGVRGARDRLGAWRGSVQPCVGGGWARFDRRGRRRLHAVGGCIALAHAPARLRGDERLCVLAAPGAAGGWPRIEGRCASLRRAPGCVCACCVTAV
jgi:hypothetical protein